MNEERNVLKDVCMCLSGGVLLLVILGIFPEWEMASWKMNRVKVFADLLPDSLSDVKEYRDSVAVDSVCVDTVSNSVAVRDSFVRIEDFTEAKKGFSRLGQSLKSGRHLKGVVRIAFLGDSYIEADIITAQVREYFQHRYGGRGVGFVPVASPAAGYRQTVIHQSDGWTGYSMVYHNKADWKRLLVSGEYFMPIEGATLNVKGKNEKDCFHEARFFFHNPGHTRIAVNADGRDTVIIPPSDDSLLQQVCLRGELNHLNYRFSQVAGFIGYGVWLNDRTGVYVDNFAVRGSSGIVLSIMDLELVEQLSQTICYDLVVLEFGLNVVMPEEKEYLSYKKQMLKTIRHLQKCFPFADILLMSVGDRGYRKDGKMMTRPGVPALVKEQREIAHQAGILFWNTYQAMGGSGSMIKFVEHTPPWANKDYTHINHLGGRQIAQEMVKAFEAELSEKRPEN